MSQNQITTPTTTLQKAHKAKIAKQVRTVSFQTLINVLTILIVLLAFIPIMLMIFLSLKENIQIKLDFWAWPNPPAWENYSIAWQKLIQNMVNSLVTVAVGTLLTVILSSASGYVFARLDFPLKSFLFMAMMALMMIPGVLTLTPSFKLMQRLKLTDTWFALWFPVGVGRADHGHVPVPHVHLRAARVAVRGRAHRRRDGISGLLPHRHSAGQADSGDADGHEPDRLLWRLHLAAAGHLHQHPAGHLRGRARVPDQPVRH